MIHIISFPPIVCTDAEILILGSIPGKRSLEKNQYYAHPYNCFWPIMGKLFGAGPELEYEKRTKILSSCGIALWDVLKTCSREGSLDSAIKESSIVPNDFDRFFKKYVNIKAVFFNGLKSEQVYKKYVLPDLAQTVTHIKYTRLPSTSPANAIKSRNEKLKMWQVIKER